jgi:hypothetical protein
MLIFCEPIAFRSISSCRDWPIRKKIPNTPIFAESRRLYSPSYFPLQENLRVIHKVCARCCTWAGALPGSIKPQRLKSTGPSAMSLSSASSPRSVSPSRVRLFAIAPPGPGIGWIKSTLPPNTIASSRPGPVHRRDLEKWRSGRQQLRWITPGNLVRSVSFAFTTSTANSLSTRNWRRRHVRYVRS